MLERCHTNTARMNPIVFITLSWYGSKYTRYINSIRAAEVVAEFIITYILLYALFLNQSHATARRVSGYRLCCVCVMSFEC